MKLIKIAAASLNQTPLDWNGNRDRILAAIAQARQANASLLCLPELCISGYGCEDAFLSAGVATTSLDVLGEIVPSTRSMAVSVGLPLAYRKHLFNVACLVVDGQVAAFVAKQHLATGGIHYEHRWFEPWPEGLDAMVSVLRRSVPLGDLIIDCNGVQIGFEICEDAWAARRPGGDLAARGVDIILNPSASHFAFGKQEVRHRLVLEGSRAFGATYVYANLLGNEAGRAVYDGGAMIAAEGRLIAATPRFSFAETQLVTAVIDVQTSRTNTTSRQMTPIALADTARGSVTVDFTLPEVSPTLNEVQIPPWEACQQHKHEELTRALSLALFDYLRKSRSHGFVVSLSGGADSTAVACFVALMVKLGVQELGADSFLERLPGPRSGRTESEIIAEVLTCVYQSTVNSSTTTRAAAATVAGALGATFYELDVDELVKTYTGKISEAIGRELTWEHDDLALQNIQARVRAPSVWLLANLQRSLLLATSNRSEAAVGYATMDGDTCGGLSPIAGIDKAFLLQWLEWLQTTGPTGLAPFPFLSTVTSQQPTAELRPPAAGQTDEQDLMPYDLLDEIERATIRDKRSPTEVYELLRASRPELSPSQLAAWVIKFFRLFCSNQWKRERYAPSFHLDDENLDPKTWCRFPILSGGFERELEQLRQHVENGAAG